MPKVAKVLDDIGEIVAYKIWCEGCKEKHVLYVNTPGRYNWSFNGDLDKPTFSPSLLIRCGHYADPNAKTCWCTYNKEHPDNPAPFECGICHSFIRDGNIQYLNDCTHYLAGKTLPLKEIK